MCATALVLCACTSTPQASPERDAEAKRFVSHPGTAALYVYRPDFTTHSLGDPALWIDNRLIGATLSGTYFRVDVRPGEHQVRTDGAGESRLTVTTASGEVYFVRLTVYDGPARFEPMDPEIAKRDIVRCCELLENWAPGQRPLLR